MGLFRNVSSNLTRAKNVLGGVAQAYKASTINGGALDIGGSDPSIRGGSFGPLPPPTAPAAMGIGITGSKIAGGLQKPPESPLGYDSTAPTTPVAPAVATGPAYTPPAPAGTTTAVRPPITPPTVTTASVPTGAPTTIPTEPSTTPPYVPPPPQKKVTIQDIQQSPTDTLTEADKRNLSKQYPNASFVGMDIFMNGRKVGDLADLRNGTPLYTTPPPPSSTDNSGVDKTIADAAATFNPNAGVDYLREQQIAIAKKYGLQQEEANTMTENERKQQLAGLYSAGMTNPLSSGVASIGTASQDTLDKRSRYIDAARSAELAQARLEANGMSTEAAKNAITAAQQQRANTEADAKKSYDQQRQTWTDNWTNLSNAVALTRSKQVISSEDKNQAQQNIKDLLTNFGSKAFEGQDAAKLAELETAAGWPLGTLTKGMTTIKERELTGKLNLKELEDGSLVNVTVDSDGKEKLEYLYQGKNLKKTAASLGGGVGVLSDKQQKDISGSTEAKKLLSLQDLNAKLSAYKDVASQPGGFDAVGSRASLLDSLYADLKIAYKEAANLGALTGPDVGIIQEAIKPISGVTNYPAYLAGGGQAGVLTSVEQAMKTAQRQAQINYNSLISKYPDYVNDPYIKNLGTGLAGSAETGGQVSYQQKIQEATASGYQPTDIVNFLKNDPAVATSIDEARKNGYKDPEILQYLSSFNMPLSTGQNGLDSLKQSIVTQESGGNYQAVGAQTKYGKALGKYQIIPTFHFAKIGLKDTPADRQKFLANSGLQDQLFGKIIDELNARYGGNQDKIIAAYYGGGAAAKIVGTKAADKPQTAGGRAFPSINQYVQSVKSRIA